MTENAGRSHDHPSSVPRTVLIVGASAAGLSVAQHLRALRFDGGIGVIGEETGTPYDRPPLTKQVLSGLWAPERANLLSEQRLSALDVELLLGARAVSLDCARREVHLDSGQSVGYEALVIATGARPRRLSGVVDGSTRALRPLDDALRIKRRLVNGSKLVVIGTGFLGLELLLRLERSGSPSACWNSRRGPSTLGSAPRPPTDSWSCTSRTASTCRPGPLRST